MGQLSVLFTLVEDIRVLRCKVAASGRVLSPEGCGGSSFLPDCGGLKCPEGCGWRDGQCRRPCGEDTASPASPAESPAAVPLLPLLLQGTRAGLAKLGTRAWARDPRHRPSTGGDPGDRGSAGSVAAGAPWAGDEVLAPSPLLLFLVGAQLRPSLPGASPVRGSSLRPSTPASLRLWSVTSREGVRFQSSRLTSW